MRVPRHLEILRREIRAYVKKHGRRPTPSRKELHPLSGQPFDAHYLKLSPLFRFSRREFVKRGGKFVPELVTSPRSLSSAGLLDNTIRYSPIEAELLWSVTDPAESIREESLARLITYSTSLFHEQNHRILWKLLPRPGDTSAAGLRRYLNFVESLVVALDTQLGDELGAEKARLGYLSGVLYDPGTSIEFRSPRERLNYAHAILRATYLTLEGYAKDRILQAIPRLHPELDPALASHAVERALRLDRKFVEYTNPVWQRRNLAEVRKALKPKPGDKTLAITPDPREFHAAYLVAEKILNDFAKGARRT